jgi:TolA-binding protein
MRLDRTIGQEHLQTGRERTGPGLFHVGLLLFCLAGAVWPGGVAWAQQPPEAKPAETTSRAAPQAGEIQAFEACARAFQDGVYERAEQHFADFIRLYPNSERLPEAILLRGRAALKLQQFGPAISLLSTNIPKAGALAEQYRYWLAQAHMENTNYQAAADSFALLAREFTNSVRLLEAGFGEALARFRLKEWSNVVVLLQNPTGPFRRGTAVRANDELVLRGELLLAEALLEQQQYAAAETVLVVLGKRDLIPDFQWRRLHLLCRVLLADQRVEVALSQTTNLVAAAAGSGQLVLQAESHAMQGAILEQLGRRPEALQVYLKNMEEGIPPDRRRESLLKVIQLTLDLGEYEQAAQRLAAFFSQYPGDTATDTALLTDGELHIKQALVTLRTNTADVPFPAPPSITNYLQQALARFHQLLTNYPQSAVVGLARLNEGWCFWMEGKLPECRDSFAQAAALLPFSPNQATALFKLADAHFFLQDYTNALKNYQAILRDFGSVPTVRLDLSARALYQVTRTYLKLRDLSGATNTVQQFLKEQPESTLADQAMLLVGQSLNQAGRSAEARSLLESCAQRYPHRPLLPEVELAIARSFTQERNWTAALAKYDSWVNRFPTNPALPRAEFDRAWVNAQAGLQTNALRLFTNFVARFPSDERVPQARLWIGDFYFSQNDFVNAQLNYQDAALLSSKLAYQARMMAGRAAFAGERWTDARDNFKALLNDNQCPSNIVVEALFGLGDTYIRQGGRERPLQKFEEAIAVFTKIPQLYPNDPRVPNAWGRIGDCYFAMANADPKNYTATTNAYHQILNSPHNSVATSSLAEVRLAMTKESLARTQTGPESDALRKAALNHYLNVLYGTAPVLGEGQQPDPFWLKEAALAGARLAEEQKQWDVAIKLYQRLADILPPLRPTLEKRIEKARTQLPSEPH